MKDYTCSRCGDSLDTPIHVHANYIKSDEFIEDEEVEVFVAYKHTQETVSLVNEMKKKSGRGFQELSAEMAHPNADKKLKVSVGTEMKKDKDGAEVNTAKHDEVDFSIPLEKFNKVRVDSPEAIREDDVALVESTTEIQPAQKMALACPDCVNDADVVIWGPDK